ncbi:Uncharacterized protein TCM_025150 [Theobroma cacao]|uniref:Uncharacterized protein n=1 Tax=Theobroma cacao TaxID=3641 RepID=A0A061EYP0_THECC|nr:Uncharacterized protein TCM_025150 [Theobroma cacao]
MSSKLNNKDEPFKMMNMWRVSRWLGVETKKWTLVKGGMTKTRRMKEETMIENKRKLRLSFSHARIAENKII